MTMEAPAAPAEVSCFILNGDGLRARACGIDEALTAIGQAEAHVWINLLSPAPADIATLAQKLKLHELAVEDVFSPQSHAKVEPYESQLFCIVPALNLNTSDDLFDVVNLNAFLGRNYLITAQRAPLPAVARSKEWMLRNAEALRRGPDFLFYRLLDVVVDEYLALGEGMTDAIDELEERIFGKPDKSVSEALFDLRRKAAWLRRLISPQREIFNVLTNRPHEFISRDTQLYLRDVYDHVQRVRENAEIFLDLLQGARETYLTLMANRTNDIMKVLTVVGTIILPVNMLTGLYGTNFEVLPGAKNPYGFWVFCLTLLFVATTVTLLIRARKWF